MRKAVIIAVLILAFCVQPVLAEEMPFTIEADDHVAFVEATQQIEAEGNVIIKLADGSIQAEQMTIFLDKKVIVAEGNVTLIDGEQEVTGSKLKYNYQTEEGKLLDTESQQDKLHFSGEVAHLQEDELVIENSSLTPCLLDDPHYKLTAKEVTVYPKDKVVARDVWLWAKDYKLLPLPTYTVSLKETESERKQETTSLPQPSLGYNRTDGAYLEVDYDHYVNQDLAGKVVAKATTRGTSQAKLDYTYQPNQMISFNPQLEYDKRYGLDTYLDLTNQFWGITSELQYDSYTVSDQDAEDYQEEKWLARWDLTTQVAGVDVTTSLEQDQDDETVKRRVKLSEEWADYYWQLQASDHFATDYQPQFSLGIQDKKLGNNTLLSADLKKGKITAEANDSSADVETTREQLTVGLEQEQEISEATKLNWQGIMTDASYGTADDYRSYQFDLGLERRMPFLNLDLNYEYRDDRGQSPFKFDDLITDGLGARHLLAASFGQDQVDLTDDLILDWNLAAKKRFYQTGAEYSQYGLNTTVDYQLDQFNKLAVDYSYQELADKNPKPADELDFVSEEELELVNQLGLTYNFQTNKEEFPYWDVEIGTAYDFKNEELAELNYSLTREFDCFNAQLEFNQLEKEVEWGLNFKY